MEPAELGLEIKLLRERRRLTGKEFAEKIGLSQSQLSRLEKGERRVEATLLGTIARVLNVPPSFFFRDRSVPTVTDEPPPAPSGDDGSGIVSNEPTEPIGRVIRDARRRLHFTAEELAYKIGRGRQFVLGVERGDIDLLNAEVTQKLCKALKIDPGAFVDAQRAEIRSLRRRVQRLERAHSGVTLGTIEVDENDASNAQLVPTESEGAPAAGARRAIPVIVGPDGGMPLEIGPDGVPTGEVESFVFVPGVRDDAAFALFHAGDEMLPAIRDGDVCVFSPRSDVRSGDFALALAQPGARPMVRQVFHDPRSTVRLQATSVSVAPILVRRDEISHLIRLVARVERFS